MRHIEQVFGAPGDQPHSQPRSQPHSQRATWADLVDVTPGERVLLVDPGHARALDPLLARSPQVDHVTPARLAEVLARGATSGPWDLVCLDGVVLPSDQLTALTDRLADAGRLVKVTDNRLSPLRMADVVRGRPRGPVARTHLGLPLRRLRRRGLEVDQVFALLRSSASPVTAFDVLSEEGLPATVRATLSHVGGARGLLLRLLVRLSPLTVARLAPAWLLVASRPGAAATAAADASHPGRIVGKVSNRDSDEFKIVRGDPPHTLEKHYAVTTPRAEIEALRELEQAGFSLAPRVVGLPDERVSRISWMHGDPLVPERLDDEALTSWTGRAADLLSSLQDLTRHDDGTVLVHGDFWLGNLLVAGDRVCGVIDWTRARRGSPEVDRRFLLESVTGLRPDDASLRDRLQASLDAVLPPPATPDPMLCWLGPEAWSPDASGHLAVERFPNDVDVDVLVAWAAGQPVAPVLLPGSWPALLLASRQRERLEPGLRLLLPDHDLVERLAARPAPPAVPVGAYHAYVDADGELVGELTTEPGPGPGASGLRVSLRADVLAAGRAEVLRHGLRGVVSVHLGRDADYVEDAGLVVLAVDPFAGPGHQAGAEAGVDAAGLHYADLAGLPRPRVELRLPEDRLS